MGKGKNRRGERNELDNSRPVKKFRCGEALGGTWLGSCRNAQSGFIKVEGRTIAGRHQKFDPDRQIGKNDQ